jgi:hypothetical protein
VKARSILSAIVLAFVLGLVASGPATAGTYSNSFNGSEQSVTSTTLKYAVGHGAFTERIRLTSSYFQLGTSTKYSIAMYNRYGTRVWSAGDQGDRRYYIGRDVTKIVITPKTKWTNLTTRWNRV